MPVLKTRLGACPTCHGRWNLIVGTHDRSGLAVRCQGCRKVPKECVCRPTAKQ